MKTLIFPTILLLSVFTTTAAPKKFASEVITKETPGQQVSVEIDITGATQLFLEVSDGGDGSGHDWADWIEPRLIAADGKEKRLTELKPANIDSRARVGKNQNDGQLKVNGKEYADGIGTHSPSRISFNLPVGYTTFRAIGGLDAGGIDQSGSKPSVQFRAYTDPKAHSVENLQIKLPAGFEAEKLYDVNLATEGSWVALCVDGKGRLIASDRQGALYRVVVPPIGQENAKAKVEKLPVEVGKANGLLEAFGSLYVVGIGKGKSGLFRLTDTNGDDHYDKVEHLMSLAVGSDHHAHAVILSPDKTRLVILCGNSTDMPDEIAARHIQLQKEDHLLPRSTYYGHNTNRMAPGGFVVSCKPDGSDRHILSAGFRNPYDIAYNRHGDLFTFDADMEYDVGGPWYRPSRVNHCISGGEFGWRFGAGKWPDYYPDSAGSVCDIGRGSPTGVAFGYGAKFPAKYQEALYVLDWTYGKIYAVHMKENGGSYTGEFEEFIAGRALPVSDIVIRPQDGAMYFIAGGRRSKSSLIRVTYTGDEPTAPAKISPLDNQERKLRHELESLHAEPRPGTVAKAWPHLSHVDRAVRFAARTAVEHQAANGWAALAKGEANPVAAIEAAIALARTGDKKDQAALQKNLAKINFSKLAKEQQLDFLRAYSLIFIRLGAPDNASKNKLAAQLSPHYPANDTDLDRELCQMLLYLNAPGGVTKSVNQLLTANTQADQMFYSYHLRTIRDGWNDADLRAYFSWIQSAEANSGDYTGGSHFNNFLKMVRKEATARLTEPQKATIKEQLAAKTDNPAPAPPPRKHVRNWTVAELKPKLGRVETGRSFIRGKTLHQQLCATCHLFKGKGGALGPDLSSIGNKYDYTAILTEIIEPSKVISDQHAAVTLTLKDGSAIFGREVGGDDDTLNMATNPLMPDEVKVVKKADIAERSVSPISLMPPTLLNTMTEEEILDLIMYLASGGNVAHTAFQQ
ncbi:MAG: NPCBM/NEW2 domain-containing protein [Akkermansiaceae bacterium]|nr:NPCBM/NEW2 domain-containing protein [Akkermansiaceae bacterium]